MTAAEIVGQQGTNRIKDPPIDVVLDHVASSGVAGATRTRVLATAAPPVTRAKHHTMPKRAARRTSFHTMPHDQEHHGIVPNDVVRERAAVLELPAGEDETLLVEGNALRALDLGLHRLDGVR